MPETRPGGDTANLALEVTAHFSNTTTEGSLGNLTASANDATGADWVIQSWIGENAFACGALALERQGSLFAVCILLWFDPTNYRIAHVFGNEAEPGISTSADADHVGEAGQPADIIANPTSASRAALTADFANSAMTGRLGDFRSTDPNTQISGTPDVVDGQIVGNLFDGRVEGALTMNGATADHTGAALFGRFLGSESDAVSGRVLQGSNPTPLNGVFAGER
jgi:hypothetical protein